MKKRIVLCLLVLALPDEDILVDYRDYFSEEELAAFIPAFREEGDRKSTRLNSSHNNQSRMPSSA